MGFGIVGYLLAMLATSRLVSPLLDQLCYRLFVPTEHWFPSASIQTAPMNAVALLMIGSWISLADRSRKVRRAGAPPDARRWLWVRAVLVAAISLGYLGSQLAVARGRRLVDARWLSAVAGLEAEMPRDAVMLRVRGARAFIDPVSDQPGRVDFERRYDRGFGSEWSVRYELQLEFDANARLARALYVRRTDDFDVDLHSCDVLVERPARADEKSRCSV